VCGRVTRELLGLHVRLLDCWRAFQVNWGHAGEEHESRNGSVGFTLGTVAGST
jgi:hypothetical protein